MGWVWEIFNHNRCQQFRNFISSDKIRSIQIAAKRSHSLDQDQDFKQTSKNVNTINIDTVGQIVHLVVSMSFSLLDIPFDCRTMLVHPANLFLALTRFASCTLRQFTLILCCQMRSTRAPYYIHSQADGSNNLKIKIKMYAKNKHVHASVVDKIWQIENDASS